MRRDVVASAVQVDPQHCSSRRRTITASANWAESSRRKQPSPSAKVKPRAPTEVETAGTSAAFSTARLGRQKPRSLRGCQVYFLISMYAMPSKFLRCQQAPMIEVMWSKIHSSAAEVGSCCWYAISESVSEATGDILTHAERFVPRKEV